MTLDSQESAARFRALYEHRLACGRRGLGRGRPSEAECLRSVLLEHVSRVPQRPSEIFRSLLDDYGSCVERRLWRALAWLVEQGYVRKEPVSERSVRGGAGHVYTRTREGQAWLQFMAEQAEGGAA